MKRRGFTLIEIVVSLMITAIMSGVIALSATNINKQTAVKEADKLLHWLSGKIVRADTSGADFKLEFDSGEALITWNPSKPDTASATNKLIYQERLTPSTGCAFRWEYAPSGNYTIYESRTNKFTQGGTIEVTGEGPSHFLVIAVIGSRMRLSDTPPTH